MFDVAVEHLRKARGEDLGKFKAKLDRALFELSRSELMLYMGKDWPDILFLVLCSASLENRRALLKAFKDHEKELMRSLDAGLQPSFRIRTQLYGEKSVEVAEVHHHLALVNIGQLFFFHFVNEVSLESTECQRSRKLAKNHLVAA